MPADRTFLPVPVPLKGLNYAKDWTQLDPDEASILQNADFGRRRGLRLRNGYHVESTCPGGSYPVEGSIPIIVRSTIGAEILVLFQQNGIASSGAYICPIGSSTWTQIATGFTPGRKWGGAVYGNKLYYGNGIDPIHVYDLALKTDAVLVAASGTVPKGNIMTIFKNRLCVAGDEANPNTLYCSAIAEPDRWDTQADGDAALAQIIGSLDGFRIVGLFVKANTLHAVRFDGSVFNLDFLDNGLPYLQEEGVYAPATANYGIVPTENDVYIFGHEGVYSYGQQQSYFGGNRPGEVSASLYPIWDATTPSVNPQLGYHIVNKENAAGVQWKGNLIFSVNTNGSEVNDQCLVYAPIGDGYGPWCEWTGISAACFISDVDREELYFFDSTKTGTPVCYKFDDGYRDNLNSITLLYQTAKIQGDSPTRDTLRWVYIDATVALGQSINLSMYTSDDAQATYDIATTYTETRGATTATVTTYGVLATMILGTQITGSGGTGPSQKPINIDHRIPFLLKGRHFRAKISVTSGGKPFELYQMTFVKQARTIQSRKYDTSQYVI